MPLNVMTQSQLNKLALSEKERLEQITKVANKISKLGKSFKDVSALLQYTRLIKWPPLTPASLKEGWEISR